MVCFWTWRLSPERVVAQPLHLYLFTLSVKVFGYYPMATGLYCFMRLSEALQSRIYVLYNFGYSNVLISSS